MHQIYDLIEKKHVIQDIMNPQNSPNKSLQGFPP